MPAAPQLALSNIINISVATPQAGLTAFNTSNLAIFTRDAVNLPTFGTAGYKIYLSPTQVGVDFGTSSNTFAMANAIFSQQPNILANSPPGYLVIIPFLTSAQTAQQTVTIPLSTAGLPPASGSFDFTWGGHSTTAISPATTVTAAAIQTIIQAATGMTMFTVSDVVLYPSGALQSFTVTFVGQSGAVTLATITSDTVVDSLSTAITPTVATTVIGSAAETIDQAIIRTQGLVQYFGIMSAEIPSQAVMLLAAAVIQPLNKLGLFASFTAADVAPGGMLDLLRTGGFTQSRGLFYNDILSTALVFMAAYAGLGFSTNFNGSNTTQTMDLKSLSGVQPDPGMSQTLFNQCTAAGADVYASIQGVPKVLCSGANDFFDNQYNLQAFVGALQVAGFNALATTNTKVPQTEGGMNILKSAYRQVCQQFVTNQFIAPGAWNSPTTFGPGTDLILNIGQVGFYVYSVPIAQQSQAQRVLRAAPLIQMAIKYAGAIQTSSVIVNVNP